MTGALFDWSSRYPGDLSGAETQKLFRETLAVILKHTFMAHLIADLVLIEQSLPDLADVDASWSLTSAIDFASASKLAASESQFTVNGDQVNHSGSSLDGNQNEQSVTKETSYSSHSLSTPTLNVGNDAAAPTYRKMHGSAPILLDQPGKLDNPDDDARSSGWTAAMAYLLNNEPRAIAMELARMQWRYFRAVRVSCVSDIG